MTKNSKIICISLNWFSNIWSHCVCFGEIMKPLENDIKTIEIMKLHNYCSDGKILMVRRSRNFSFLMEEGFMGDVTPFTNFFDFWLCSSTCEKDCFPVLSKLSLASLIKNQTRFLLNATSGHVNFTKFCRIVAIDIRNESW